MTRQHTPPWDPSRPSILAHVRAHLPPDGGEGFDASLTLPDEDDLEGEIRFVPGAMDGVAVRHFAPDDPSPVVEDLVAALWDAKPDRDGSAARARLYELARSGAALSMVDPLVEQLRALGMPTELIQQSARWLMVEGRHRDPVKLGIALLGLAHTHDDRAIIRLLGRHDEFTLYAAVALANTTENPEGELFDLARHVHGWGRIEIVERLRDTTDPQVRDWIFRHGFRNSVMYEYLVHIAATVGDLAGRLEAGPDDEELDAACEIVDALLAGGPAEDIDDYDDGARAVLLLLEVLADRASKLSHFLVTDAIAHFLDQDEGWERRADLGWTAEIRARATRLCARITALPQWEDIAVSGLASDDDIEFYRADRVARALGIDTFAAHWRRVTADPVRGNWWMLMEFADDDRIGDIVALAERSLPLDEIASGPGNVLGLGPEWAAHAALGQVVHGLARFPGQGWPLIRTALRCPVTSNRHTAIRTLNAWGRTAWPVDAAALLRACEAADPDEQVRERLGRLLRGESLED